MADDDDEFDLPDAEAYFAEMNPRPLTENISKMLEEFADEFVDDDLEDGTAARSCLGLPELLERILLYVPPLEVYRLQRVNTMFRDLITRSIPIRRHMYFVPEKYYVRKELNKALGVKCKEKSTLAEALYPFRFELYSHRNGAGIRMFPAVKWADVNEMNLSSHLFDDHPRLTSKTASWRTILILDSGAPVELDYYIRDYSNGKWFESKTQIQPHNPFTLGDLVDLAISYMEEAWQDRGWTNGMNEIMLWGVPERYHPKNYLPG